MMGNMPEVYEGSCDYAFLNYAHADREAVLPIIRTLVDQGYRVWYDDGIEKGAQFPDYIGDHVRECSCLIMFISHASMNSPWCKGELYYAMKLRKGVLPVYLEDVELIPGLQVSIGTIQSMLWYEFNSDIEFYAELFKVKLLDPCLKRRKGVGKREEERKPKEESSQVPEGIAMLNPDVSEIWIPDVRRKESFAEYSWGGIKDVVAGNCGGRQRH